MKSWELFTPQVVFMVTTKQGTDWRCKPFSWLVPLNKGPLFGIMIKRESQTLANLLNDNRFSIATIPAGGQCAQDVLMTTAPDPETRKWPVEFLRGMAVPAPACALVAAECVFLGYSDLLAGPENDAKKCTHLMALGRISKLLERFNERQQLPLLHSSGTLFAEPKEFEVKGY